MTEATKPHTAAVLSNPPVAYPQFIHIDVTVTINALGLPIVTYSNLHDAQHVGARDAVFRFRLTAQSGPTYFVGMSSKRPPVSNHTRPQMSPYSISLDKKTLICSDACSDTGKIDVTLQFVHGHLIEHDPQVGNEVIPPPLDQTA